VLTSYAYMKCTSILFTLSLLSFPFLSLMCVYPYFSIFLSWKITSCTHCYAPACFPTVILCNWMSSCNPSFPVSMCTSSLLFLYTWLQVQWCPQQLPSGKGLGVMKYLSILFYIIINCFIFYNKNKNIVFLKNRLYFRADLDYSNISRIFYILPVW
jgi:hypothetical protein